MKVGDLGGPAIQVKDQEGDFPVRQGGIGPVLPVAVFVGQQSRLVVLRAGENEPGQGGAQGGQVLRLGDGLALPEEVKATLFVQGKGYGFRIAQFAVAESEVQAGLAEALDFGGVVVGRHIRSFLLLFTPGWR